MFLFFCWVYYTLSMAPTFNLSQRFAVSGQKKKFYPFMPFIRLEQCCSPAHSIYCWKLHMCKWLYPCTFTYRIYSTSFWFLLSGCHSKQVVQETCLSTISSKYLSLSSLNTEMNVLISYPTPIQNISQRYLYLVELFRINRFKNIHPQHAADIINVFVHSIFGIIDSFCRD